MKGKQKRGAKLFEEKAERHLSDMSSLPVWIPVIRLWFHRITESQNHRITE